MATREEQKRRFEELNRAGFEGDHFIESEIAKLCERHKITTIFETGARYGHTTVKLAKYATTISCELDQINFGIAKQNVINKETGKSMALIFNCDSVLALNTNLKNCKNQNILLYLDAHGPNGTPLLGELQAVIDSGIKPVIVIHDFKVPDRSDLGFDTYNGQAYTWEWIKPSIEKIYGELGYCIFYNNEAAGSMRGVIYIEPEVKKAETFVEKLEAVGEEMIKNKKGRKKKSENGFEQSS